MNRSRQKRLLRLAKIHVRMQEIMKKAQEVLIRCPRCNSHYSVSCLLLNSKRMVRCSVCGHIWHEGPFAAIEGGPKFEQEKERKDKKVLLLFGLVLVVSFLSGVGFWFFLINKGC